MNWKEYGRKQLLLNWKHYPNICPNSSEDNLKKWSELSDSGQRHKLGTYQIQVRSTTVWANFLTETLLCTK